MLLLFNLQVHFLELEILNTGLLLCRFKLDLLFGFVLEVVLNLLILDLSGSQLELVLLKSEAGQVYLPDHELLRGF